MKIVQEAELPKSRSTGKMYAVIVFKKSEAADKVMDDRFSCSIGILLNLITLLLTC